MITITEFYHPYLEHEDVINIVMSSFADKAVANFIDSVKDNDAYKKHIVKDDIFTTYANFIKNVDNAMIVNDFVDSFDIDSIIDLVVEDADEQLAGQDIDIDPEDESLPYMAKDTLKNITKAIVNKSEIF